MLVDAYLFVTLAIVSVECCAICVAPLTLIAFIVQL